MKGSASDAEVLLGRRRWLNPWIVNATQEFPKTIPEAQSWGWRGAVVHHLGPWFLGVMVRQIVDQRAKREGYRGRAAYKILELDDKFRFLVPGARVVDLGCAPGGWCQVAVQRVNALGEKSGKKIGRVLGVDLQEVEAIAGAEIHQLDFLSDDADLKVKEWLGGPADVVMSDMAAAASGHKGTDHLRIIALCEAAAQFAFDVLEEGGTFVAKVLAGGAENELQTLLKRNFAKVANVKPPASRFDSQSRPTSMGALPAIRIGSS